MLIVSLAMTAGVLILTFKLFFSDRQDYLEAWHYFFALDVWSFLEDELSDDRRAETNLTLVDYAKAWD